MSIYTQPQNLNTIDDDTYINDERAAILEYDGGLSIQKAVLLDVVSEQAGKNSFTKTAASYSREGIEAIKHAISHGIKIIGAYEGGAAIASGSNYEAAFTSDI